FFGDTQPEVDWFILAMRGGKPEIQIFNNVTKITVSGGPRIDDGKWHQLNPAMDGCMRRWNWLNKSLEWQEASSLEDKGTKRCFRAVSRGSFFPGDGLATFSLAGTDHAFFRGCLRAILVHGRELDLDAVQSRSNSIWAHSCPGEDAGGDGGH
uniref:Laminin G domain-containing protein n=1 Tax=Varanus komodoensis TaxID=61221 RepID=A0A8D2LXB4_VARKO